MLGLYFCTRSLDVHDSNFSGSIPSSLYTLASLSYVCTLSSPLEMVAVFVGKERVPCLLMRMGAVLAVENGCRVGPREWVPCWPTRMVLLWLMTSTAPWLCAIRGRKQVPGSE